MKKGLFITFEGGDGSGKTTQIGKLTNWMTERGIKHVVTKEPGCPHLEECMKIRQLVLDPKNDIASRSELLLFLADRAQHVERFIRPKLNEGVHVLCDRYSDSTRVYQGSRGLSRQKIDLLLEFTTDSLDPDLTFLLDVPVEIGLSRARAKSIYKNGDRMEQEGLQFHEDVRHGFLKLAENIRENRFCVINATPSKTIDQVHDEIVIEVSRRLWINGE
jgi:dTMP kinase